MTLPAADTTTLRQTSDPVCSVVIGLVSTEDRDRILETLAALAQQDCAGAYETIVVDRINDAFTQALRTRHPEVRFLGCEPDRTLPQMHVHALMAARGPIVAITEDHCVPAPTWIGALLNVFSRYPQVLAVGGSVTNGEARSAFHWATFLCEYARFLPPVAEGPSTCLPGMNIAYRRATLNRVPPAVLSSGFWETTVHPLLAQTPAAMRSTNAVTTSHRKAFSARLFLSQRFAYSRYFAGRRFADRSWIAKLGFAAASIALPALLLLRVCWTMRVKRVGPAIMFASFPYLVLFCLIWAVGELVGTLRGQGDALCRIE
jgi:cellulose synthase/poly-beta-1,6-N-acetylglucosamine synthase-like glycosyltransferase